MTTQSFPANAVNLFIGTAADALVGSMSVQMKVGGIYYTDGTRLIKGTEYTVPREWGKMAVEKGWAKDVASVLPTQGVPAVSGSSFFETATGLIPENTSSSARAWNAAILSDLFSTPGRKLLPVGDFTADPFVATASVTIEGAGAGNGYGPINTARGNVPALVGKQANTIIRTTATTGDLLTVLAPAVRIIGIQFEQSGSTPTAGSAVRVGGTSLQPADNFAIHDCTTRGFWTPVDVQNSVGYSIHDNIFFAPVKYGVRIQNTANGDEGDPCIYANWFCSISAADAAIYFKSGGGLKISGNKIWRAPPSMSVGISDWFRKGIWIDNPDALTSVMTIIGNSLETIYDRAIFVDCSATGYYGNFTIQGNQIFEQGASGQPSIEVLGRAALPIHGVSVSGNVFMDAVGIKMDHVQGASIGPNTWRRPRSTMVILGTGAQVDVIPQTCSEPTVPQLWYEDRDAVNSWKSATTRGNRIHSYTAKVSNVTTLVTLFKFSIPEYSSTSFSVDVFCSSSGNGTASMRFERMLSNEAAAGLLVQSNVDTGVARISGTTAARTITPSVGNPICGDLEIQMPLASVVAGDMYVTLGIKLAAGAAGAALNGTATLRINGVAQTVQVGPG